ncbi:Probable alpha-ketoglutarate-dependent hypophosphite dioxygenase [Geodia barretti]|uniref:Probable alpha-ketoglutarate-dependent hypophosphite dioxygenase n=1 Tax=Geodia barretti TaxID=519541 RepID=A0AA35RA49_GEOBA|nr:Probable alpha-ketoglutarate-dependent hypophosphite dioxygenase [Geodia barretti]
MLTQGLTQGLTRELTQAQIDEYHERGFIGVEGVLTDEQVAELQAVTDDFIERSREATEHTDVFDLEPDHTPEEPKLRRIKEPHLVHDAYDRVMRDEGIVEMASQVFGSWAVRTHGSKLNMKSGEFGSPVHWHQDWAFYPHTNDDVLAVGVAIDDMTRENGCLLAIPGSHRGPILDHNQDGAFVGRGYRACLRPGRSGTDRGTRRWHFHPPRAHAARVDAEHLRGSPSPAAADVLRRRRLPDLDRGRPDDLGPVPRHLRAGRGFQRGAHVLRAGAAAAAAADPLRLDLRDAARVEGDHVQVRTPARSADCAAASRAIGTRNGEHDT